MNIQDPRKNCLLAAIPPQEFASLAQRLEPVTWTHGTLLYEFNEKLKYIYFPTSATVSLLCSMEDGAAVEVAEVGNEGVLDVAILLGGQGALTEAIVQTGGEGFRLAVKWLTQDNDQFPSLRTILMRYTRMLISQMAQTTGCMRRHSVEQQFCRCLLLNFDRMNSTNLAMTQELIAHMLGVRRETVTEAAGRLQQAGYISYRRGKIEVLDRPGLEAQACECYKVVRREFDSLRSDLAACSHTHHHHHEVALHDDADDVLDVPVHAYQPVAKPAAPSLYA